MGSDGIRRIQDTIHGLMEFSGMENSVVDVLRAKELQRLRRIRQLGLAHLVFPAAEHSRLVHCIGAAHVAARFARHLRESTRGVLVPFLRPESSSARDLSLAALCHDLGHGPLSHAWEREVVGEHFDRALWVRSLGLPDEYAEKKLKWHELVGQALLLWADGELHQLLETQERGFSHRISKLLLGSYYIPYLPRLLSSDVDVDRADFILRDAYQTGVAYGRYDLDWLISTATVGFRSDSMVVGFDQRKAPRVVEQFLIARRALYETVYHHKTVHCAEGMVGLFFKRVKELAGGGLWAWGEGGLLELFRRVMAGGALGPHEVLALDDHSVWVFLQHVSDTTNGDATASDLARRLISRDLFKFVPATRDELDNYFTRRPYWSKELAEIIRPWCRGDSAYYFFVDRSPFRMFADSDRDMAFFVDTSSSARGVTPIREHPQLRVHSPEKEVSVRLFVPREAVPSVLKAVRNA